jgi:hypothetical protein
MSTVEQQTTDRNTTGKAPRMWHICNPDDHSVSLCGRKLTGKANWSDADINECVVCADLAASVGL